MGDFRLQDKRMGRFRKKLGGNMIMKTDNTLFDI